MSGATVVVAADGSGDFATLGAAVQAVARQPGARILLRNGVYREKIFCDAAALTLQGESRDGVRLVWADAARDPHPDGRLTGTFRSYTAFFTGEQIRVRSMTIENAAGPGRLRGQGIAVAVDARRAEFDDVALLGYQDTLFTGPLPARERLPGGFLGPRQFAPRLPSAQLYRRCRIAGEVDFIFGGADALFEDCTLLCRGEGGFVAAPSTAPGGLGYVFHRCAVRAAGAPPGSFHLARPWRPHGRCAFLRCALDEVIAPAGFDDWGDAANRATARFAEYGNTGPGAAGPRAFGAALARPEAQALLRAACERCAPRPKTGAL